MIPGLVWRARHGRAFLSEFKDRGLYGMERIGSDVHEVL